MVDITSQCQSSAALVATADTASLGRGVAKRASEHLPHRAPGHEPVNRRPAHDRTPPRTGCGPGRFARLRSPASPTSCRRDPRTARAVYSVPCGSLTSRKRTGPSSTGSRSPAGPGSPTSPGSSPAASRSRCAGLRYGGSAHSFGFAIYSAARGTLEDAVLLTGSSVGTPQEAPRHRLHRTPRRSRARTRQQAPDELTGSPTKWCVVAVRAVRAGRGPTRRARAQGTTRSSVISPWGGALRIMVRAIGISGTNRTERAHASPVPRRGRLITSTGP